MKPSRCTFPNLVIYLKVHSVLNNSWSKFTVRPASAGVELVIQSCVKLGFFTAPVLLFK